MPKTITIPDAGSLAFPLESSLTKLPGDAVHNHLHQVAERSKEARTQLEGVELSALILCAVELEEIKGEPDRRNGSPWKDWVKSHCDFSHKTATKYDRVLKAARLGLIEGLHPEALPEIAPSRMSADQLQDACHTLAASLQGLGGIRQLYLKLDIIALPSKTADGKNTIEANRNDGTGGRKDKSTGTAQGDLDLATKDAIHAYRRALADLDQAHRLHLKNLPAETAAEIIEGLQTHLEQLGDIL